MGYTPLESIKTLSFATVTNIIGSAVNWFKLFNSYCMAWYGSQILDLSGAHIQKVCTGWNKAVRKIWHLPYRTHCSLLPHLMQTVNMNSELVCRYVKLYDNMCKCNNINVYYTAKYAKYNVHGPLGINYVQV